MIAFVIKKFGLCLEDIMTEVSRREKEAGIVPDPDLDTYMKVSLACPIFCVFYGCGVVSMLMID